MHITMVSNIFRTRQMIVHQRISLRRPSLSLLKRKNAQRALVAFHIRNAPK